MNQHLSIADTINRGARRPLTRCCPFCGTDPLLATVLFTTKKYQVCCENEDCPAQPQVSGKTPEEVWAAWNTRSTP